MKARSLIVGMIGVLFVVGCESKSPPGGPGATGTTKSDSGARISTPENAFRLEIPSLETSIAQGESKTITVGLSRGKNFDQDVKLDIGQLPQGVKIAPANPELKASDKNVQITIEAAKDAALGHHTITLTGSPSREGAKTTATLKIEVKKT